jgi:hypothetical protein
MLYPATKFTKAEVIEYYLRVAPFILPHLKGRPVTLKRYPDGVTREAYWEKDAPSFTPEWVETFPVPRRAGGPDISYILVQNTATLAWAANAAALELHPYLHRAPEIENPTSIVFDLDPGEGADLRRYIQVAFEIKAARVAAIDSVADFASLINHYPRILRAQRGLDFEQLSDCESIVGSDGCLRSCIRFNPISKMRIRFSIYGQLCRAGAKKITRADSCRRTRHPRRFT